MKCPLLMLAQRAHDGSHTIPITDCLQEECAWWLANEEGCAVLVAAAYLVGLVAVGDELLKKIPHEEQFRR